REAGAHCNIALRDRTDLAAVRATSRREQHAALPDGAARPAAARGLRSALRLERREAGGVLGGRLEVLRRALERRLHGGAARRRPDARRALARRRDAELHREPAPSRT